MAIILGIDPGIKGALAVFDTAEQSVAVHDMPDTTVGLVDLIASLPSIRICAVEKPFYPKIIGMANAAKIAMAYGKIIALLTQRGIPTVEVRPADWKAALNLGTSKSASRERATQIFPGQSDLFARAKDDGRAEAALIAWYALRWAK